MVTGNSVGDLVFWNVDGTQLLVLPNAVGSYIRRLEFHPMKDYLLGITSSKVERSVFFLPRSWFSIIILHFFRSWYGVILYQKTRLLWNGKIVSRPLLMHLLTSENYWWLSVDYQLSEISRWTSSKSEETNLWYFKMQYILRMRCFCLHFISTVKAVIFANIFGLISCLKGKINEIKWQLGGGKLLATCSADRSVKVTHIINLMQRNWEFHFIHLKFFAHPQIWFDGREVHRLEKHRSPVTTIEWKPIHFKFLARFDLSFTTRPTF